MIYFPSTQTIKQIQAGEFEFIRSFVSDNKVKTLDFSHKRIDSQTALQIAQAIRGLDIQCLNMSHNALGLGAVAFAQLIKDSSIKEIDLSRNGIGTAVADVLQALLASSVKVAKLAYNRMGSEGLRQAQPLVARSSIEVDLSNNLVSYS